MPREYFRFPALNNPKDIFSKTELTESENEKIELIINKAQKKMNIRNDENIVKEYYTKLEFISLFSSFEAYLENIYIEYFQKDDDTINATKIIEKAGMLIKKNSTDNYLKEILMIINPELKNLLLGIKENIFDFFYLAYLVRNIHTHKLGKTSNYFIKKGILKNIIKKEIVKNDKNEIIEEYFYVDCLLGEYKIVEQGKYFSLKELTALFRSYTCEIAYILDNSVYQNKGK